jgi:hypothetical protein
VLLDARRVAWARGTNAKTILVAGETARVIVFVAGDLGADLLIIGNTPRLAAKTRRWLDNHAPCPVLPMTADRPALAQPGIEPVLVT